MSGEKAGSKYRFICAQISGNATQLNAQSGQCSKHVLLLVSIGTLSVSFIFGIMLNQQYQKKRHVGS
jgi:hypothetical protein